MKDEYDFSSAQRGRFYRPGANLVPPLHLDPDVLTALTKRAEAEKISLNELVNSILRQRLEDAPTG